MKMTMSEAGKLGIEKVKHVFAERAKQRIDNYNLNPIKCKHCEIPLDYHSRKNKFCSKSCSAKTNNNNRKKNPWDGTKEDYILSPRKCIVCSENIKFEQKRNKCCSIDCANLFKSKQKAVETDEKIKSGTCSCPQTLRKWLFKQYGNICSICKLSEWMGKPIPLIADHIDGNPYNNISNNLRLVCGNCDMQLPTYKSKNKGNGRHDRMKRYYDGKSY